MSSSHGLRAVCLYLPGQGAGALNILPVFNGRLLFNEIFVLLQICLSIEYSDIQLYTIPTVLRGR